MPQAIEELPPDRDGGMLVVDGLDCSRPTPEYLRRLRAARVGCVHFSAEDMDPRGGLHPFVHLYEQQDASDGAMRIVRSVADIRAARANGAIAAVLGWQGADPIGVDPGALRAYVELGLRVVGVTYNIKNAYGGGCLTPDEGLTPEGRTLVERLGRWNVLLDVGGHTGERASLEAIERADGRPVICSHTAMAVLNPNPRNTSDRVCEAIAATGGVVGVLAINDFLVRHDNAFAVTPQAPLDVMLDHIEYLRGLVGVDHIGLGPDFVHGQRLDEPTAWPGERFTPEMVSAGDEITYVRGFESIDELPNVVDGLVARGWSSGERRKLLGDNWLRVYERAWGG